VNETNLNTPQRVVRVCCKTKTSRKRAEEIRRACHRALFCEPLERVDGRWTFVMVNRPTLNTAEVLILLLTNDVMRVQYDV
jgi:hypothetical protein